MTWPPTRHELERYDVLDVPEQSRVAEAVAAEPRPTQSTDRAVPPRPVQAPSPAPDVVKPDWSELRLRTAPDEMQRGPRWPAVTIVLLLVALAQAGYIWYLHTAGAVTEPGRVRIDGPDGADVRIGGRAIGAAPVEHVLDAGEYDIELSHEGRLLRAERVSVGVGRTVVLMVPSAARADTAATASGPGSAPKATAARSAAARTHAANADMVSATTGAVTIESTTPGLPVTMGGRSRGVTPLTLGKIPPGRHDVLVGGMPLRVDVKPGEVATLRVPR
jgi:PEGA domain